MTRQSTAPAARKGASALGVAGGRPCPGPFGFGLQALLILALAAAITSAPRPSLAADDPPDDSEREAEDAKRSAEQKSEDEEDEDDDDRPGVRHPRGSISLGGGLGVAVGGGRTRIAIGVGVGYAVLSGVVPGVRGVLISSDGLGGEVAATLTLTPPLRTYLTPFALGEVGRRWEPGYDAGAWMYGGGLGLYLGEPDARVALQLGWMFRRLVFPDPDGSVDASGPLISISVQL